MKQSYFEQKFLLHANFSKKNEFIHISKIHKNVRIYFCKNETNSSPKLQIKCMLLNIYKMHFKGVDKRVTCHFWQFTLKEFMTQV